MNDAHFNKNLPCAIALKSTGDNPDTGEVIDILDPAGTVRLQGETWNAESLAGVIAQGKKVRIKEMKNLKLYVEPIDQL